MIDKKVLVTAGPTYEPIDPVRFIGNHSSGKMGFALAECLANEGAEVVLVSGPVNIELNNKSIKRVDIRTAEEMYSECFNYFPNMDGAVLCAAVADFAPETMSKEKIKRKGDMEIKLKPTKDIAKALGRIKKKGQVLVGFALETDNEKQNALKKRESKNLDFIVLNSLNIKGAGFQTDTNKITIMESSGKVTDYEIKPKREVAEDIVDKFIAYFH